MPVRWNVVWAHVWTMPTGPRLFLSDAPIADPCSIAFVYGACGRPLAKLPTDGILVTFEGSAVLTLDNAAPVPVVQEAGGWYSEIDGDQQISAVFQGFGVTACLRGPDLASKAAAFRKLVASKTRLVAPLSEPRAASRWNQ